VNTKDVRRKLRMSVLRRVLICVRSTMRKPSRKTIKRNLDKLFSAKIRSKGYCEKCGKTTTLQCAHIYSRSYLRLRWVAENAFCSCSGCHFWWHKNPLDAIEWVSQIRDVEMLKLMKQKITPVKTWEMIEWYDKMKNDTV